MSAPTGNTSSQASVQEFSIRVPKNSKKRYNVMRFNGNLNVDFTKWTQVKMERENNIREYKGGVDEEMPKFGAGSEFGRDAREEARRMKYGITSRKYKADDQPWILKSGGKTGKKFKGIREGGFSENAAYYVFINAAQGAIEAFPLNEWYNFQPIQRYKALSAEEAEQEFSRRNNVYNYFNLMAKKMARNENDGAEEEPELGDTGKTKRPTKKEKDFKISEMDEWMDSDDDESESEAETEKKKASDDDMNKKKKKTTATKKKKKKRDSDDEAFEESDDGDEEGRECDYISDSSDSDTELEQQKEIKSVAEEDALRKLLASDEEEEDEENAEKEDDEKNDDEENGGDDKDKDKNKDIEKKKDKKKKKKQSKKKDKKPGQSKDSSSEISSDSGSDSDVQKETNKDNNKKPNSAHSSRSATPTPAAAAVDAMKRKQSGSPDLSQAKRSKLDNFNLAPTSYIVGSSDSGITEDAVRRYLARKPITTTELLQKFKSKKTGLSSEQLVNVMTQILKKINPTKQTIKNKMYLSLPKA